MISEELKTYVEEQIIPLYDSFDGAHQRDHVKTVIEQSAALAKFYPETDEAMVYVIAAYHDTGLQIDREHHHINSAKFIRADKDLRRWFSEEQIEVMADAAEDHRASAKNAPRTIYGKIVAEADRVIKPLSIIRRTIQFGLSHYPELDKEGHWQRTLDHLHEKYAEGGYLKLWIPESDNAANLEQLRVIIKDEKKLRGYFEEIYDELVP